MGFRRTEKRLITSLGTGALRAAVCVLSILICGLWPKSRACGFGFVQATEFDGRRQEAELPELISDLDSSDVEKRMNALTRLTGVLSTNPGLSDDKIILALANTLTHDQAPVVRAMAARSLEKCLAPLALEKLTQALKTEREIPVRKAIIYAMAPFRSSQTVQTLLPFLKQKDAEMRAASAFTLSEIHAPESFPQLLEFFKSRTGEADAFARSRIAAAFGAIGDRAAIEALVKALGSDHSQEVRRESARALGALAGKQDPQVIAALETAKKSSDPYLRLAAEDALTRLQPEQP
jgi:HEAT repeat protein